MTEIGAYEAKTHLSELLARVAEGEQVVITKHGTPIAYLVPAGPRRTAASEVIRDIRQLRKGVRLKKHRLKDLIAEGRR
ncbi:MAG TPA: type II toxin-antitoxin system prevent-host-death family antitoxin [bacterium]|nr:type II toxin-antitoxin system prevent-host-death family antitoxin [bacterium]